MSEPESIDCHEVAAKLYEYLDGELTEADDAAVRNHLADCAPCFGLYDFESIYLRFLEARARTQGAPASLKKRILDELLFDQSDTTTS